MSGYSDGTEFRCKREKCKPYLSEKKINLQYTFKLKNTPAKEDKWHLERFKLKVNYCR